MVGPEAHCSLTLECFSKLSQKNSVLQLLPTCIDHACTAVAGSFVGRAVVFAKNCLKIGN